MSITENLLTQFEATKKPKLSDVELIAKKWMTAKTHKTRAKYDNVMMTLSPSDRQKVIVLNQTHSNPRLLNGIYANSYLLGGDFKPQV